MAKGPTRVVWLVFTLAALLTMPVSSAAAASQSRPARGGVSDQTQPPGSDRSRNVGASDSSVPQQRTGTIQGVVVDARTTAPVEKVLVRLRKPDRAAITDARGRFRFEGVEIGVRSLSVSVVGYILVEREVEVREGGDALVTIPLSDGTGTYTETVTVTADVVQTRSVQSQQTLNSGELQDLRGVLTDDALRAVQVLPGVVTGDDFRSEFSVRGSDYRHLSVSLDGVATPLLIHTVRDVRDPGSIAMINSDILQDVVLLNGAYPQLFGNRTGAQLEFVTREGSRDKTQTRLAVSGTSASVVLEGPLGKSRAGSWLLSARQSYLDWLVGVISNDEGGTFGFTDAQSKLVYDVSARDQLQLNLVAGRSRHKEGAEESGAVQTFGEGSKRTGLVNLSWRHLRASSVVLTQRLYALGDSSKASDPQGRPMVDGTRTELSYRVDVAYSPSTSSVLEGGGQIQRLAERLRSSDYGSAQSSPQEVSRTMGLLSAYAQFRWNGQGARGLFVQAGTRVDRSSLISDTTMSPWLQTGWRVGSFSLKAGAGLYQQFPGFEQVDARLGAPGLRPERAWHYDVGVEHQLGDKTRWQLTLYDREERDFLRRPDAEVRLANGQVAWPVEQSLYQNVVNGHSRGVEVLLQRKSPNGLSGWLSYSLGFTRSTDTRSGEVFWGDVDQRHTFNMYGHYRFSARTSVTAKFRAGSNVPVAGYFERRGDEYYVSDRRNQVRLPAYSRLDVRANRTFNFASRRLTLFVEVLNVYGRRNLVQMEGAIDPRTLRVMGVTEKLLPLLPSAGILFEF